MIKEEGMPLDFLNLYSNLYFIKERHVSIKEVMIEIANLCQ